MHCLRALEHCSQLQQPSHSNDEKEDCDIVGTGDKGWFTKQHAQQHANRSLVAIFCIQSQTSKKKKTSYILLLSVLV
jgi:hypothetical protein